MGAPGAFTTKADPLRRCVRSSDIEGELAVDDVIDLARIVSVHDGRAATRWHAHHDGEQRAARFRAGGQHGERVSSQRELYSCVRIDR